MQIDQLIKFAHSLFTAPQGPAARHSTPKQRAAGLVFTKQAIKPLAGMDRAQGRTWTNEQAAPGVTWGEVYKRMETNPDAVYGVPQAPAPRTTPNVFGDSLLGEAANSLWNGTRKDRQRLSWIPASLRAVSSASANLLRPPTMGMSGAIMESAGSGMDWLGHGAPIPGFHAMPGPHEATTDYERLAHAIEGTGYKYQRAAEDDLDNIVRQPRESIFNPARRAYYNTPEKPTAITNLDKKQLEYVINPDDRGLVEGANMARDAALGSAPTAGPEAKLMSKALGLMGPAAERVLGNNVVYGAADTLTREGLGSLAERENPNVQSMGSAENMQKYLQQTNGKITPEDVRLLNKFRALRAMQQNPEDKAIAEHWLNQPDSIATIHPAWGAIAGPEHTPEQVKQYMQYASQPDAGHAELDAPTNMLKHLLPRNKANAAAQQVLDLLDNPEYADRFQDVVSNTAEDYGVDEGQILDALKTAKKSYWIAQQMGYILPPQQPMRKGISPELQQLMRSE